PQRLRLASCEPVPARILISAPRVPNGSEGARPVKRIAGLIAVEETLYPTAILPTWSMAALPIQRKLLSGAKVPCWKTTGVAPGLRISYQRIPVPVPAVIE